MGFGVILLVFSRVLGSSLGAEEKEKQSPTLSWRKSRFCLHFGSILGPSRAEKQNHDDDDDDDDDEEGGGASSPFAATRCAASLRI